MLFPVDQVWVLAIGGVVPLIAYVLNHVGPWVSEPVKATVLAIVAAAAGVIYTAAATNTLGWNNATFQLLLTAVAGALAAHHAFWKPAGISTKLGAGSNAP